MEYKILFIAPIVLRQKYTKQGTQYTLSHISTCIKTKTCCRRSCKQDLRIFCSSTPCRYRPCMLLKMYRATQISKTTMAVSQNPSRWVPSQDTDHPRLHLRQRTTRVRPSATYYLTVLWLKCAGLI